MMSKGVYLRPKIILLFLILLGMLFSQALFSQPVLADRSFTIEQIYVDAEVLPDAAMQVTEKITVNFSGAWNGFFITIPQGNSPIKDIQVLENGQSYILHNGTDYGPPGTFIVKDENGKTLIDWSIKAENEKRTFDISYRVMNAVQIHSDVGELYRKFISDGNQHTVGEVTVTLRLPPGAEGYKQGEDIRIWGHGPLHGEVNFTAPDTVVWQVKNLPAYTFLEGRVVMPIELFPEAPAESQTGQQALPAILAEEEGWAEDANSERWMARGEIGGAGAVLIGVMGFVVMLWRKYKKPYHVQFSGSYYRELPGNYSPGELSVLWNFNKVQAQDFTATILDLARRKFLRIDEEEITVRKLLGRKEVKTYRLTFLPSPKPTDLRYSEEAILREHEQELLDYLKQTIAGGKDFLYLRDIEDFAKKNGKYFYVFWQQWTSRLQAQTEDYDFFDHSGNMPVFTIIGGLIIFIAGAALINVDKTIIGIGLIMSGAILGLVPRSFKRRSLSGQEDYTRWQAFRRFLLHFSQMGRHEIPSLIIWEHYLVYAVTLGVAREVIKQLELVFPKMEEGDYRFGYGWYAYGAVDSVGSFQDSFNSIGNAIESSLKTARSAASKSSSGSGGGGGFSSGGGGGGGSSYGGR